MKKLVIGFLKRNWFWIALIIVCFLFLRKWGTGYYDQKHEIESLTRSIERMESEYHQRGDSLSQSVKMVQVALHQRDIYQDSIQLLKTSLRNLSYRHEIEMDNLRSVPSDSLYIEVTRWLDNLSFD